MEMTKNRDELRGDYVYAEEASKYLHVTIRKISLYRRYGMLKSVKVGRNYVYRLQWLDDFMESWAGYDLSNAEKIKSAIRERGWRKSHDA